MKPVYFISDLHFREPSDETERRRHARFCRFVEMVGREASRLYIVGDYFDFWFEYRRAIPKHTVWGLHYLMMLRDAGVDVHYVIGNHDCWMVDFIREKIGIPTYPHPMACEEGGRRILLVHGDGLSALDGSYKYTRPLLRSKISMALYRLIHPDLGIWLADRFSDWSKARDRDYQKYANDRSVDAWVTEQFARGFQVVMMGHHHTPRCQEYANGTFISLGDWVRHATYAVIDDQGLHFRAWEAS